MNLDYVRKSINSLIGIRFRFKYIGFRNQIDEFFGYIDKTYPYIFTIIDDSGFLRSFSYNDVIVKSIRIYNLDTL